MQTHVSQALICLEKKDSAQVPEFAVPETFRTKPAKSNQETHTELKAKAKAAKQRWETQSKESYYHQKMPKMHAVLVDKSLQA